MLRVINYVMSEQLCNLHLNTFHPKRYTTLFDQAELAWLLVNLVVAILSFEDFL